MVKGATEKMPVIRRGVPGCATGQEYVREVKKAGDSTRHPPQNSNRTAAA